MTKDEIIARNIANDICGCYHGTSTLIEAYIRNTAYSAAMKMAEIKNKKIAEIKSSQKNKKSLQELTEEFVGKYGADNIVTLNKPVCIIHDDFPSSHSSGANGYITKVRFHNDKIEYYVNWWDGGWKTKPDCSTNSLKKVLRLAISK